MDINPIPGGIWEVRFLALGLSPTSDLENYVTWRQAVDGMRYAETGSKTFARIVRGHQMLFKVKF